MNFKSLLITFFALVSLVSAEPVLRLHDGTVWSEIDAAAWEKLPRTELTAKARDGKDRKFSGVAIAEILKLIGAPSNATLKGPEMNRVILFTAADGYQVTFSLAELDEGFRKVNVILADRADGQPLSDFEGPRMLVSADDLKHSRWIRQVTGCVMLRATAPAR